MRTVDTGTEMLDAQAPQPELVWHSVEVAGRPIRYLAGGTGTPIIFVHGLSGSTHWWRRNIPAFVGDHRLYLVDLPGFGSMRHERAAFALDEAAAWLAAWMEAVGVRHADLVGHSMGGYICLRLAATHPELVRRLVLAAASGVPTGRTLTGSLLPLTGALLRSVPRFWPILVYDAARSGPGMLLQASREILASDIREALDRIAVPTLILWGEHDTLLPPPCGALLKAQIRGSRLIVLSGAGHVPMFERPIQFNAAMRGFLSQEP